MVTGGAGFIGSNLVDRLLAEGVAVDVVDDLSVGKLSNLKEARAGASHDLTFHQLDVCSTELVDLIERRKPQVIFHLAAQCDVRLSVFRPAFDAQVNMLGTIRVLEGAKEAGTARVVFPANGAALYGPVEEGDLPLRESHPHRPISPHGVSKSSAIAYLVSYRELHSVEFCALALANVYGPRQDPFGESGVIARFAGQILGGEPVTIFGEGEQSRDFVFVDDAVDAFVRAATRGGGLLINVGTGQEVTVGSVAQKIAGICGVDLLTSLSRNRLGEVERSSLDPERASIHLGWRSWTELDDGLRSTVQWVRSVL
jgi:UDP-glucose 4-epimerase